MMKDCDEEDSCDHRDNFDLTGGRRAWFPRVSLGWTAPQACLQRKRGTSPPPPPPLVYAFLSGLIWFPLLYPNFVNCPSKYKCQLSARDPQVRRPCHRFDRVNPRLVWLGCLRHSPGSKQTSEQMFHKYLLSHDISISTKVPTLRSHLGQYFTNTTAQASEEESLRYIESLKSRL